MLLIAVFLAVVLLGLLLNVLLMAVAWQVRDVTQEIRLVIVMALVDGLLSTLSIAASAYHLATGLPIAASACNAKGAIDFLGTFVSMLLVATISLLRSSPLLRWRIPLWAKWCTAAVVAVFALLVALCAVHDEFRVNEAMIYCSPASFGLLVSAMSVMHACALLLFLAITVFCYSRVVMTIVASRDEVVDITQALLKGRAWLDKRTAILRTSAFILSYLAIVLPVAALILLEALAQISLNTPIDFLLASLPVLNATLILFAHSTIFKHLALFARLVFK